MLSYILPFILLILIVVFIHEYGHYYFAKKYGVGVTDFQLVLVKKYLVGVVNQEQGGKFVGFLGGYVKFFGDRNVFSIQSKKLFKNIVRNREKLFVLKPLYQSFNCFGGPLANFY